MSTNMAVRSRIAQRCLAVRTSTGLSQTKFAAKVGFAPITVSRWERGVILPDRRARRELAAVSGKSESHFSPDEGEEAAPAMDADLMKALRIAKAILASGMLEEEGATA